MDFGFWSIIPPILTLTIALVYKNILAALFIGILTSSVVANGVLFIRPIAEEYMMDGLGGHTDIFIMLLLFGPFLAAIKRAGGFAAFTSFADKKIKSARGSKLLTWALALCCFDQSISTMGIGSIMRPITDKHKIPREKLGFILSSTGPAFCSLVPFTIFILFYSGVIAAANPSLDGVSEYIKAIPFNFYGILSVAIAFLYAAEILPDFGYMKKCEQRAKTTGQLIRDGSIPMETKEIDDMQPIEGITPDILCFILPFAIFIGGIITIFAQTGSIQLITPFLFGMLVALLYPVLRGYFKVDDIPGIIFTGAKSTMPVIIILFLAFSFASAVTDIGFAAYIIRMTQGFLVGAIVPAIAFAICGLCAFATGSLVSGLIILAPIAISLATSLDANLTLTIAACLGGAMFGDQTSPLSDMVVQPSMGAGVDIVDLTKAQFPYKFGFAVVTFILYLIFGFVM